MKPKKRTHTSVTGQVMFGTDADFHLASTLPYGRWTLADGREILFNGFLEPMWERRPGAEATPADPYARISRIVVTEWIYGDAHRHHERRHAAKTWLDDFRNGLRITLTPERQERAADEWIEPKAGVGGRRWK